MTHLSVVGVVCTHLSEFCLLLLLCNLVSQLALRLEAHLFAVKADHPVSAGSHVDDHVLCLRSYELEACASGRSCTVNETCRSY